MGQSQIRTFPRRDVGLPDFDGLLPAKACVRTLVHELPHLGKVDTLGAVLVAAPVFARLVVVLRRRAIRLRDAACG